MKKLLTLSALVCFLTLNIQAQLFQNTIGKTAYFEIAYSIAASTDSTYLIGGEYYKGEEIGLPCIIHLKKDGSIDWSKKINIAASSWGYNRSANAEPVKKSNGKPDGYIVRVSQNEDCFIVRLTNTGTVSWAKQITEDEIEEIKPSYDAVGTLTGFIMYGRRGMITKLGPTGNTIWVKIIAHPTSNYRYWLYDLQTTSDGGCIIGGNIKTTDFPSVSLSPVLFKLNSTGAVVWSHSYTFSGPTLNLSDIALTSNGYAITGALEGGSKCMVFKTDVSGNLIWSFSYSSSLSIGGGLIVADATDNIIVLTQYEASPGNFKNIIFKLNPSGTILFAKELTSTDASFYDIRLTAMNTYCVAGRSKVGSNYNILAANISSSGGLTSGCQTKTMSLKKEPVTSFIVGIPAYNAINSFIFNDPVTATTENIQTDQSVCAPKPLTEQQAGNEPSTKLQVANDMSAQRVAIKWITAQTDNNTYEAILYNHAGQAMRTISLRANQAAFISMNNLQTGIYGISLKLHSSIVAREKVVWFK